MSLEVSSVSVGHVWIVSVIAALVVVTLAKMLLVRLMLLTRCPSGMSGARCENATSSMSQDVSSVSVGHVWIVGVIAALVVVTLAIIVLLMYYLRKKG